MSDELINPNGYETGHVKELGARFAGGKVYYAKLGGANLPCLVGTEQHKRASEADAESAAWKARLVEEYDAAVLAMVANAAGGEPEPAGEAG